MAKLPLPAQAGKRQIVLAGPLKRLGSTGLMDS